MRTFFPRVYVKKKQTKKRRETSEDEAQACFQGAYANLQLVGAEARRLFC